VVAVTTPRLARLSITRAARGNVSTRLATTLHSTMYAGWTLSAFTRQAVCRVPVQIAVRRSLMRSAGCFQGKKAASAELALGRVGTRSRLLLTARAADAIFVLLTPETTDSRS